MKKSLLFLLLLSAGSLIAYFLFTSKESEKAEESIKDLPQELDDESIEEAEEAVGNDAETMDELSETYRVVLEKDMTSAYAGYLYYKETLLAEIPREELSSSEELLARLDLIERVDEDIILLVAGRNCGGSNCVGHLDRYYVVKHLDRSVEEFTFTNPGEAKHVPSAFYTIYSNDRSELISVSGASDVLIYNDSASYYEEVWEYSFDNHKWSLLEKLVNGTTLKCSPGYGLFLDSRNIYYGDQGELILSPIPIPAEGQLPECELT